MMLNPVTMRLGIASILVGLAGAYGVRTMIEEDAAPEAVPPRRVSVPVASADLPANRDLRRGDVAFVGMTLDEMTKRGWDPNKVMMDVEFIIKRQTKRPIRSGQPFLTHDVHLEDYAAGYTVRTGMRAVQIRVADDRGGKQVMRGDTVDVFFTSIPQPAKDGRAAIPEKTLQLAEGVAILHIDQPELSEIHWARGYRAKAPIFTLEIEPDVAAKITALKDYGDFTLMARAADEPAGRRSGGEEYTLNELLGLADPSPIASVPVEVWYGSERTVRHFPVSHVSASPSNGQLAPIYRPRIVETKADQPDEVQQTPADTRPRIPYRPRTSPDVQRANDAAHIDPAASPSAEKTDSFIEDGDAVP